MKKFHEKIETETTDFTWESWKGTREAMTLGQA